MKRFGSGGVRAVLLAALVGVAGVASASGSSTRPTAAAVTAAPRIPLGARKVGAVPGETFETGAVVLKPRDPSALTQFIASVTTPGSSSFHHYLGRGAYAGRFGPAQATISAVKSELESHGLRVTSVSRDALLVSFSGSASQIERAFQTGLARYTLANGSTGQATTSAVHLPSAIAGSVTAVLGLDDLVHPQALSVVRGPATARRSHAAEAPHFTHGAGSPSPCSDAQSAASEFGGLTDDQIANAYGAFGLYNAGDLGAGQHIAIFELEPFEPSDIQTFDTCYFGATTASQMAGRLSETAVDGGQPTGQGSGEAILDVEDVSAMAPAADIDVYEAPNNTFGSIDEYSTIVNSDIDQVVSTSWGECEQAVQEGEPGAQQAENLLFEQAAAQGQSVFAAAGDTGSNDCNAFRTTSPVSPVLSVDDPSSQPYVVSVGGTTIDDATQPASEHVWNDAAAGGAGGGGISESWPMPTWQLRSKVPGINNPTNVAAAATFEQGDLGEPDYDFCTSDANAGADETACREVPDVSAQADEFTGAITIYSTEFEAPGTEDGWITIGGTSSATPIWASMLAVTNASATCQGDGQTSGVGFVSPLLYAVASNPAQYTASFNDITAGNNDPYGDSQLFPATTGYDMASGLGSPQLTAPSGSGAGLAYYLCSAGVSITRPAVTGLSPSVGATTGTVSVTISGSGFESGVTPDVADVQVGSFQIPFADFTVNSGTQITATFPAAADTVPPGDPTDGAGRANVLVTLTDGETSAPTAASAFDYVDESGGNTVPAVTSVHSYGGHASGGNTVEIFGSGFTGVTGAAGVTFGGVDATSYTVENDWEIQAIVPAESSGTTTCVQDGSTFSASENAGNDICQAQVVVTNTNGSSATSTILPLYEGIYMYNPLGAIPAPAGEEAAPAPTEYDYLPTPTISSVSTSQGPSSLASEYGGTVITITGAGFNAAGLDWVDFGDPTQASSQDFNLVYVSGTEIQIAAPGLPAETVDTSTLPVSITTIAGQSSPMNATYAGIPTVSSVLATSGPTSGNNGGPDTGGTPINVTGQGFANQLVDLQFADTSSPYSLGTQYKFTANSDDSLSSETVPQNPAVVDVQACTVTDCSSTSSADLFYLYPPGDPKVDSISPTSGPAAGGTSVTITGENLGCVTGVLFGSVAAETFSNAQALLDCGSTNTVTATAPPGTIGTNVPVKVTTVESDLTGSGPSTSTATFTYTAPPAPAKVTAPSISGTLVRGQTLKEKHGTWTNTPTSYASQWERCNGSGASCIAISGATSQTYALTAADVSHTIRVRETARNAGGPSSPATSAATAAVADSVSAIKRFLRSVIAPSGKAAKIGALLKSHGYSESFSAPEGGRLTIAWYRVPKGATLSSAAGTAKAKPVLVATGSVSIPAAGRDSIKLRLTASGRKLLKHSTRLKLVGKASFKPAGQAAVSATKSFKVRT